MAVLDLLGFVVQHAVRDTVSCTADPTNAERRTPCAAPGAACRRFSLWGAVAEVCLWFDIPCAIHYDALLLRSSKRKGCRNVIERLFKVRCYGQAASLSIMVCMLCFTHARRSL